MMLPPSCCLIIMFREEEHGTSCIHSSPYDEEVFVCWHLVIASHCFQEADLVIQHRTLASGFLDLILTNDLDEFFFLLRHNMWRCCLSPHKIPDISGLFGLFSPEGSCLNIVYLMSPNFLVMALPKVLKAADVFCPAVEKVSDVFLNLVTGKAMINVKI